jgi:hypothetical protein
LELELGMLAIAKKLVKDKFHLWRWNLKKNKILFLQFAQTTKK